jgi:hypothetical protein
LEQGILDATMEASLMAGCGKVENVAEVLATPSAREVQYVKIQSAQDSNWHSLRLHANVRARIEQELTAGFIVIVPMKNISNEPDQVTGWWRVDPRSGQTLGVGKMGWGQSTTEALVDIARMTVVVVSAALCIIAAQQSHLDVVLAFLCSLAGGLAGLGIEAGGFAGGVYSLAAGIVGIIIALIKYYKVTT